MHKNAHATIHITASSEKLCYVPARRFAWRYLMRNYVTYLHDNADGDSKHDDSVDGCHVASDG